MDICNLCIELHKRIVQLAYISEHHHFEFSYFEEELPYLIELLKKIEPIVLKKIEAEEIDESYVSYVCYSKCKALIELILCSPTNLTPEEVRDTFFDYREKRKDYVFKFYIKGIDMFYI